MALNDRLGWLFPDTAGIFAGVDLARLDPAREEDRTTLIEAEHPDLAEAIATGQDEVVVDGRPVSPQLHVAMHSLVANQISADDPSEVWLTAQRLVAAGHERHEVLDMLVAVVTGEVRLVLAQHAPFDLEGYVAALRDLPEIHDHPDHPDHHDHHDHPDDHDHAGHDHDHAGHDHADHDHEDHHDHQDGFGQQLQALLDTLRESGPLSVDEIAARLSWDRDRVESLRADPLVAVLADDRLANAVGLLSKTTFTHRLTAEEAAGEDLCLATDTAPLLALVCGDDHVHLADGQLVRISAEEVGLGAGARLRGPAGWLGDAVEDEVVGFRLALAGGEHDVEDEVVGVLDIVPFPAEQSAAGALAGQVGLSFARFGETNGLPVRIDDLLHQLAVDAPEALSGVVAPLSQALEEAGFEQHFDYTAPKGTDWEAFDWLRNILRVSGEKELEPDETEALILMCRLNRSFGHEGPEDLDREVARNVGALFQDPDLGEAFAEANQNAGAQTVTFLAFLRQFAGRRNEAGLAWTESLVCGRGGDAERGEACLQAALLSDPDHPGALEDAAWYASDRGDACQALRYLRRLDKIAASGHDHSGHDHSGHDHSGHDHPAHDHSAHDHSGHDHSGHDHSGHDHSGHDHSGHEQDGHEDDGRLAMLRYFASAATAAGEAGRSAGVGRNARCPCGSGRKFKQCCLITSEAGVSLPLAARIGWLWEKLQWWLERAGPEMGVYRALVALRGGREAHDQAEVVRDVDVASSLVLFADRAIEGFLRQRGPLLPHDEAELIAQLAREGPSLYEVTGVAPGEGPRVNNLRTGKETATREHGDTRPLGVGDVVFGCAAPDGSGHQFLGRIVQIPLDFVPPLIALLDQKAGSRALAPVIGDALSSLTAWR